MRLLLLFYRKGQKHPRNLPKKSTEGICIEEKMGGLFRQNKCRLGLELMAICLRESEK